MSSDLRLSLEARARRAGLEIAAPLADRLLAFYALLSRWNRTINLTSLADVDEAIDRLLLEPLQASAALPRQPRLMDLGSGGGSPAIPLALALEAPQLVMVESRGRKAAFLREAAREVGVQATVEAVRFEDLAARAEYRAAMDVVSMRAVRMDESALDAASAFVRPDGVLALFVTIGSEPSAPAGFEIAARLPLLGSAELVTFRRA